MGVVDKMYILDPLPEIVASETFMTRPDLHVRCRPLRMNAGPWTCACCPTRMLSKGSKDAAVCLTCVGSPPNCALYQTATRATGGHVSFQAMAKMLICTAANLSRSATAASVSCVGIKTSTIDTKEWEMEVFSLLLRLKYGGLEKVENVLKLKGDLHDYHVALPDRIGRNSGKGKRSNEKCALAAQKIFLPESIPDIYI